MISQQEMIDNPWSEEYKWTTRSKKKRAKRKVNEEARVFVDVGWREEYEEKLRWKKVGGSREKLEAQEHKVDE